MAGRKSTAQRPRTQRPGDVPANVPVASTQARPTTDVTQGVDASQDAQKRYVAPARTAGGFAGSAPQPHSIPPQYPEMEQATPEKPLAGSIGATGTSIMSGILVGEDYNPDFGWRRGVEIFDQMRRSNGTVRAIEQLLAMPLRAATWSIKPASDKPEDKKLASFVESALFHELEFTTPEGVEQHQTWDDLLRHICLMMTYGFMPFEMVWREDDAGYNKWAQWIPLLPKTVWRWWVNQQTDLVGIQQRTYINYGWYYRDIPASKMLLFTNEREGNNYEGMSVFRAAYPHWFYLQQYYKIQAVGIERNAVTPPIGYLSRNASGGDRDNLFQVVQNMRVGESMGAVIQADEKIEYPANHQHQGADVQAAIDHHMQMVAQAAVTSFLTLGASAKGAYNLAESLINMLMTLLQARAQYICDTINAGPIKQLIRYNFGPQAVYPQLTVGRLTATDITRVANALGVLSGYIPPSNEITDFLTKMIGLPEASHSEIQATNPSGKGDDGGESEAVKETQRVGMQVLRANFNPALSEPQSSVTQTGVMVAFPIDADAARRLAWPDGEPADELHITLAYLGDAADLSPNQRAMLQRVVREYAALSQPLWGMVSGIDSFPPGPHSDGKRAVYAAVEIAGIEQWRQGLVNRLKDAGLPVDATFKNYVPHITLAYIPDGEPLPKRDAPQTQFWLNRLMCAIGGASTTYPISEAADIATEARLLREAIGALTGSDAVERGMQFFNPNHDARGRFAPGGAGGAAAKGGGRAPKAQGAEKAPKGERGGKAAAPHTAHGGGGAGGHAGAEGAKAGGKPRGKVVNMQRQHERQEAKKARIAAKQDEYNRIHAEKLEAAKKEHEAALENARKVHAEQQPKLDAINKQYRDIVDQHGENHPEAKRLERESAKEAKPLNAAYVRLGRAAMVQGRLENEGPKQAAKPAAKTIDVHVESRRQEAEARAAEAKRQQDEAHAKSEAIRKADNGIVRAENGKWVGETSEQPPFSPQQFERANLKPLGGNSGINESATATINGQKYLIKRTDESNALGNGHPGIVDVLNHERYETHAEAASPRIAEAMGLGGHSVEAYAFEHNGQQYVAVRWQSGMKRMYDSPNGFNRAASEADFRSIALHEYVVGEVDRHQGNYLYSPKAGKVYTIDHGRSMRLESAKPEEDSGILDAWGHKVAGGNATAHSSIAGKMRFDTAQLKSVVAREPEVLSLMRQYKLDAGIPGVQRRFEALRQLSNHANPTLEDLHHIGSQIDQRDGVASVY